MAENNTPETDVGLDEYGRERKRSGSVFSKIQKAWKMWALGTTIVGALGGGAFWWNSGEQEKTEHKTVAIQKTHLQEATDEVLGSIKDNSDALSKGVKKGVENANDALVDVADDVSDATDKVAAQTGEVVEEVADTIQELLGKDGKVVTSDDKDVSEQALAKGFDGKVLKAGNAAVDKTVNPDEWRVELDKMIADYPSRTQLALRMGVEYLNEYQGVVNARRSKDGAAEAMGVVQMRDLRDRMKLLDAEAWTATNDELGSILCGVYEKNPDAQFDMTKIAKMLGQTYARMQRNKEQTLTPVEKVVKAVDNVVESATPTSKVVVNAESIVPEVKKDEIKINIPAIPTVEINVAGSSEKTNEEELKKMPEDYQTAVKDGVEIFKLQNKWFEAKMGSKERHDAQAAILEHQKNLKAENPALEAYVDGVCQAGKTTYLMGNVDFRFDVVEQEARMIKLKDTMDLIRQQNLKNLRKTYDF